MTDRSRIRIHWSFHLTDADAGSHTHTVLHALASDLVSAQTDCKAEKTGACKTGSHSDEATELKWHRTQTKALVQADTKAPEHTSRSCPCTSLWKRPLPPQRSYNYGCLGSLCM